MIIYMEQYEVIDKMAYNLTMEYIRQNNILQCKTTEIATKLRDIESIYNEFCIDLMNQTKFLDHLKACFEADK